MPNYLHQLAVRIQQPELAIQPRPLSLFESPNYSKLEWSNLGDLPESRTGSTVECQETSKPLPSSSRDADQLISPTEDIRYNESRSTEAIYGGDSVGKSHQPQRRSMIDQSVYHGKDRNRPEFERTEVISELGSIGQTDQPHREYVRDRPPVTSHAERMEDGDRASELRDEASWRKPGQELLKRTDRGIRSAVGERVEEEQSGKTSVAAVQPAPPERRTGTVLLKRGVGEEGGAAQHIPSINQHVDPPLGDVSSSVVSVLWPHLDRQNFRTDHLVVPQHDVPHVNRSLEGKISVVPNSPPMPRLEMLATHTDRGEVRHATDRGPEPPTIQVSIGRIEVRATVASTPTKKVQSRSSAMSLDEYLARRNEVRS